MTTSSYSVLHRSQGMLRFPSLRNSIEVLLQFWVSVGSRSVNIWWSFYNQLVKSHKHDIVLASKLAKQCCHRIARLRIDTSVKATQAFPRARMFL